MAAALLPRVMAGRRAGVALVRGLEAAVVWGRGVAVVSGREVAVVVRMVATLVANRVRVAGVVTAAKGMRTWASHPSSTAAIRSTYSLDSLRFGKRIYPCPT